MRFGGRKLGQVDLSKVKLGDPIVTVEIWPVDIAYGECSNRARCPIANAFNRQFKLGGFGSIVADANSVDVTKNGKRYRHFSSKGVANFLRRFDEIAKQKGIEAARKETKPTAFRFETISVKTIPPPATRERMDQINKARREREAERRANGTYMKPKPRYAGV